MGSSEQQYMQDVERVSHISPTSYVVVIFLFMTLAILTAGARTAMRIIKFKRLDYDDVMLVVATLFMVAATVLVYEMRDSAYYQVASSLGFIRTPPPDFIGNMISYSALSDASSITTWGAIFSVKFAFITFFRKLVARQPKLQKWWWCVFAFLCVAMPFNMFGGFMICWDFSPTMLETCTVSGMTYRETIYQIMSAVLDIFSDVLIISIPIALLWKVKINMRRKMALGTVCCLSIVMIILAVVRLADSHVESPVSDKIPMAVDSPWLYALQIVESGVAIIMVSITAFRSMLGQSTPSAYRGYEGYDGSDPEAGNRALAPGNPKRWTALSYVEPVPYAPPLDLNKPLPQNQAGLQQMYPNRFYMDRIYETRSDTAPSTPGNHSGDQSWV